MELTVLTPEKKVFEGTIDELQIPAHDGLMGILKGHAPIITSLSPGIMKYKQDGKAHRYFVSGGFLEFSRDKAVVLADASEKPEEIDRSRVKDAIKRAKNRLSSKDGDVMRARQALARAIAREVALKKLIKGEE